MPDRIAAEARHPIPPGRQPRPHPGKTAPAGQLDGRSRGPAAIRTLVLRLHRPTRRKQDLLRQVCANYAAGIQQTLDRLQPEIALLAAQGSCPSLTALSRLMTPADLRHLKPLGLEPMADGLRIDLAMLLLNYLAHVRNGQPASYPVIQRTPDAWQALADEQIAAFTAGSLPQRRLRLQLERTLPTIGRSKSVYFGRHAATRDFCLLYQPETGRFFAKLYLMNRAAARDWSGTSPAGTAGEPAARAPLFHLTEGHPPLAPSAPGDRFIVMPLDMGRKQHSQLLQAWQDPGMVRTARLCRKGDAFDLHVQVRRRLPETRPTLHLLSLVRSPGAAAAYALCRPDGSAIRQGTFDGEPQAVAEAVCQLARQTAAQVVFSDLFRRRDGLFRANADEPGGEPFAAAYGRARWQALRRLLDQRLPADGFPKPIPVSPHYLYQTCPVCQNRRKANRLRDNLLICTACGSSHEVAQAASLNLVQKLLRYQRQRQLPPDVDRTVP